ncbi:hypothetical protein HMPREF1989_01158 [Porphyromonas gingivalis F0566]|nr:hypothetical protein HMPREF1989_01158 [Porphyromonas gingivalis F0566]
MGLRIFSLSLSLSDFNAVKPVSSMNYEPKKLGLWSVNPEKTARDFFRCGSKNF